MPVCELPQTSVPVSQTSYQTQMIRKRDIYVIFGYFNFLPKSETENTFPCCGTTCSQAHLHLEQNSKGKIPNVQQRESTTMHELFSPSA